MKRLIIFSLFCAVSLTGFGQKYMTQSGHISFYSEAPLENIESINNQVSSVLDMENGNMAFSLLMNAFVFEKALMQEHFNEKYIESPKFPKASFKGSILNFDKIKLTTDKSDVKIKGTLTIHGVSQEIIADANLALDENGNIIGHSEFYINVSDYDIKIPAAVVENISKQILVIVKMEYEKLD